MDTPNLRSPGDKRPKVSVLLSTFNRPQWVLESVSSVLAQDCDLELIILDHGSEPETAIALDSVYDPRVKKLRVDSNGINPWRYMAPYAKGEYIVLFTDDDLMLPGCLSLKAAKLDSCNAGMVFGPVREIDQAGTDLGPSRIGRLGHAPALKEMVVACPVPMTSAMFRREYLTLMSDQFDLLMDWGLWLDITYQSGCEYIPEDTVSLRIHPNSDTNTRGVKGGGFAWYYPRIWKHWICKGIELDRSDWTQMLMLYCHMATSAGDSIEDAFRYFHTEIRSLGHVSAA